MKRFDPVRIKATGEQGIVLRVVESTVEDRFGVLLATGDDRLNYFTVREIEPLDEPFGIDTRTSSDDVPVGAVAVETFDAKTARLEREVVDATLEWASRPTDPVNCGNAKLRILATGIDLKDHLAAGPETDGAMLERLGDDATKWTAEFTKHFYVAEGFFDGKPATFGDIASWFANAIEHSHALRIARIKAVSRERIQAAMARFGWMPGGGYDEQVASMLGDLIDGRPIELTGEKPVESWSREDIRSLAISYCSAMEGISASHDGSERFTFRGARLYEFVYRILAGEKP